jgi:uncharacterized membrane protein
MADDDARQGEGHDSGANGAGGHLSGLASKEILIPAAVSAVGALAAAAGPGLVRKLTSTTEQTAEEGGERLAKSAMNGARDALGNAGVAGKVLQKALPGGGGGSGSGGKKTRRLPIQRWTDVAVPVDRAYEAWLEFDKYPKFMHRVLSAEQKGSDKVQFNEKIWFSKRQWEARITDKRENDRIAWKTTSGMSHKGIVSFHRLDDKLTRVMVDMDFEPTGMIEKMASGLRFVKRAVQADLARFKAYVELADAKGIEYRSTREDDDEQTQQQDGESRSGRDDKDDEARDAERREREGRREERRQAVGA